MIIELTRDSEIPKDSYIFSGIATKEVEDDEGDILLVGGMNADRIIKNPSIKRDHSIDADDSIGRLINLRSFGDELHFKAFISATEPKIIKKIQEGVIVDISMGFMPTERDIENKKIISKWTLFEVSLTGTGMLNEAVITGKSKKSKLSLQKFHLKTMEDVKKEEEVKEVEKEASLTEKQVSELISKSVASALEEKGEADEKKSDALELKKFKEDKKELTKKGKSFSKIQEKSFDQMSAEEQKEAFYTKMVKHRATKSNDTLLSLKAMSGDVDTAGGYTIPTPMNKELFTDVMNEAVMLPLVTMLFTKNRSLLVPVQEVAQPTPITTSEGAAKTELDGTLRNVTINVYKIASLTDLTDELIEDSEFDIIMNTINILHQNAALVIDTQILEGLSDAGEQMEGIMTNVSIPTVTAVGATNFDPFLEAVDTLPVRFRKVSRQKGTDSRGNNLAWIVGTSSKTILRTMKDTSGRYYWSEPIQSGEYPTLDGHPVIEVDDSFLPANQILFGNFKKGYTAIIKNSGTISQSMHYKFNEDKQTIRFVARMGGKVIDPNAFVIVTNVGL